MHWKPNKGKVAQVKSVLFAWVLEKEFCPSVNGATAQASRRFLRFRSEVVQKVRRVGENGERFRRMLAASIGQLNTLRLLTPRPIGLVVYERPQLFKMMGYLILRCASRKDAFSVYQLKTRLPGYALGRTTDAPKAALLTLFWALKPTRSGACTLLRTRQSEKAPSPT